MVFETYSHVETEKIAEQISNTAKKGDVFCLTGDLGVGKTIFAKGFARGLGVKEDVTSPTFAIINIYEARLPFYHFDVYRINHISEMEDTGYEEFFYGDGVCLVEWADLVKGIIPDNSVWINISKDYSMDDNYRKIIVEVQDENFSS